MVVEEQGNALIIDPGVLSKSLPDLKNVQAIVVTHIHSDHFDLERLKVIAASNPKAKFFGPQQVAAEAVGINMVAVDAGTAQNAGSFQLSFYGGKHELYEEFENIAVFVNEAVFHPGDSYTKPDKPIKLLGLPASAPWLRVSDTVEFLKSCRPQVAIPIHNSLLSEVGESIHYRIIAGAAQEIGTKWQVLKPGESLEV